jgi:alpha-tubulin suppressor-like RCC1 family protein
VGRTASTGNTGRGRVTRTTKRAQSASIADSGAAGGLGAMWDLRNVRRLLPAVLATVLLAAAVLSGTAWARGYGAMSRFRGTHAAHRLGKSPYRSGPSNAFVADPINGSVLNNLTGAATSIAAAPTGAASKAKAPKVTKQPASMTVEEGQSAVFEAAASGVPPPTAQWEISTNGGSTWSPVAGATSVQLTIANTKTSESGNEYRAVFNNAAGEATSRAVTLTVHKAPVVTKQPVGTTVEEGQSAVFEATASGFPTPTVQWEISTNGGSAWSPVAGATGNQLTIANTKTSESGNEYRSVFKNVAGEATSEAVTLTVHKAPVVTKQPVGTTVEEGQSAVFEATASGFPTPTVQWEISTNGGSAWSPVAGATGNQLMIANTKTSESGNEYRSVFKNVAGEATSEAATLTVATHHYHAVGWGANASGQLGDGNTNESDVPVTVSGLKYVTSVAAGERHSLALLSNGTVVAWGADASGQLGDGETTMSDLPVAVEVLTGVKAITAGDNHSLALLSNGTVMAWGGNEQGQLGDGNTNESDVPVAVKGLTGVTAISAGGEHSLALLSNGTVMAWGGNGHGQLGDGHTNDSDVPVAVKGLAGVTAVAAGGEHSLALLSNGTVMAWGGDEYGQLGNSTVEAVEEERISDVPVAVSGVSGVTAITAGARHSLALLSNGTVMAWGENEYGELGDGSIARSDEVPVAVSGLSGVAAISAGGEHSLALLLSGKVMSWGEDKRGELGNGSVGEPSDIPVAVSGLGEVAGISAGGLHDLAYGEPIPTVTSVSPGTGSSAGGTSVSVTGIDFTGATAVRFGASSATSFTVNSPTSITAVSPAETAGTVDVTVTTPAGTSPTGSADRFSYLSPPTVEKLSTTSGPAAGGTAVTITGSNLEGATSVSFGSSSATSFTVNSATSITALSPAETAGTVYVTVTTPIGTSTISRHDRFKLTPAVESVAPNTGSTAGGTTVTIAGAGFAPGTTATSFKFGSKRATAVDCTSSTSCTVLAPAHAAGTVEVTATVSKLKSPGNPPGDQFTYD